MACAALPRPTAAAPLKPVCRPPPPQARRYFHARTGRGPIEVRSVIMSSPTQAPQPFRGRPAAAPLKPLCNAALNAKLVTFRGRPAAAPLKQVCRHVWRIGKDRLPRPSGRGPIEGA